MSARLRELHPVESMTLTMARGRAKRGASIEPNTAIILLTLIDRLRGGCCEFHNANCEPPSELCCDWCSERAHPDHLLAACVLASSPESTVLAAGNKGIPRG
jgi:hypothetical protein